MLCGVLGQCCGVVAVRYGFCYVVVWESCVYGSGKKASGGEASAFSSPPSLAGEHVGVLELCDCDRALSSLRSGWCPTCTYSPYYNGGLPIRSRAVVPKLWRYAATVRDLRVVLDHKKVGNHWSRAHQYIRHYYVLLSNVLKWENEVEVEKRKKKKKKTGNRLALPLLVLCFCTYAAGLCLSAELGETQTVAEQLVGLTVRKSQLLSETDEKLTMVFDTQNNESFINRPNYVVWGPVIEQFRQWQCGKEDPETGEAFDCYGACLATMHYQKNISSPRMLQRADIGMGRNLRGEMVRSAILNPETGAETKVAPVTTASEYSVRLNNTSISEDREFRCMTWNATEPKWQSRGCKTLSIVTDRGQSYQHCQCAVPGYLGVFAAVKSRGGNSSESSGAITRSYKTVKYIIHENYTAVVGDRKEAFEDYLTTETANKLGIMRDQVHNLTVSPGSILVEFQLMEETGSVRSSNMEDVEILYDQLQKLVNSGQLSFEGFTSAPLTVLPQNLDGSGPPNRADTNRKPIIIAGVVAGLIAIVLVGLAVAIFLKYKKQRDKVSPIQSAPIGSLPPSYRSIHFEQSLDGTAGSVAKRNPQYADLDTSGTYTGDGLYIEHHGKSSASSTRSSGLGSSLGSGGLGTINDDEDAPVPAPFRYKSPTKSELDRSGPIPPHILERMRETEKELPTPGSDDLSLTSSSGDEPKRN
ncbi:GPS motif protein [Trinorchestia longiramus]|nr:GPS motif protein [Trinorchestia longiramus]